MFKFIKSNEFSLLFSLIMAFLFIVLPLTLSNSKKKKFSNIQIPYNQNNNE
jgi:hypothetical protein